MSIQTNITTGILSTFESPIGVYVTSKLNNWQFLQQLGFAAQLKYLAQNFHGYQDFVDEMAAYSAANAPALAGPWNFIYPMPTALKPNVNALMYEDPVLGQVGTQFLELLGLGAIFAIPPSQLGSSLIQSAISTASSVTGI